MTDMDLIDKVAELWVDSGGDVDGFWFSVRRIADSIEDLLDDTKELDAMIAREEAKRRAT